MKILDEAHKIVNGDRNNTYGDCRVSFKENAKIWSVILGKEITPQQVALCMIALKLRRENYKHKRDNLVDMVGYIEILDKLYDL